MEFKSFLSHRYKSPDVNLYFFDIFSRQSEVQFEVDVGSAPTCVTRLEYSICGAMSAGLAVLRLEGGSCSNSLAFRIGRFLGIHPS